MKIYFAGSIRGGRGDREIYFKIIETLSKYGTVLTEHVGRESVSSYGEVNFTEQYIYQRDVEWIDESDIVIAEITTPSLGVGYEIGYAEAKNKKILCLYRELEPGKKTSAMLAGNSHVEVKKYSSVEELPAFFNSFFKNENKS